MIKKLTLCALSVIAALPVGFSAQAAENDLQLQQVFIFSRHNLRAPLADNGSVLAQSTKKNWPQWDVQGGYLTTKGGVLETYMGHYFREWLAEQGLIKANTCPTAEDVFVYANSLQRTIATAQFFTAGAFPGCDIAVTHQDELGTMDPIFNPVISTDNAVFSQSALAAMEEMEKQLPLTQAFRKIEKIVDYKNAPACQNKKVCELSGQKQNQFIVEKNKEPGVNGPLKVGNALVDAFTLQYYQGFPLEQIAWGQIQTPEQWRMLSAIKNGYQDVLFTSPVVAREVAAPLVDYIRNQLILQDRSHAPSVTVMVGHDANIAALLSAMEFQPYSLPEQYEKTPIGGQLVFERWHDTKSNKDLLKTEYVYQTADQMRDAQPLTLKNPAKRVTLQMKGCPIDKNGYCEWERLASVLATALQGTALQPATEPATTTEPEVSEKKAAPAGNSETEQPQTAPAGNNETEQRKMDSAGNHSAESPKIAPAAPAPEEKEKAPSASVGNTVKPAAPAVPEQNSGETAEKAQ